jgi:hypothetical protein
MKTFKITTCLPRTKQLFEELALKSKVHHSYECSPDGEWDCWVALKSGEDIKRYTEILSSNNEYADIKNIVYQAMIDWS